MRELRELLASLPVAALALAADVSVLQLLVVYRGWHYLLAACAGFAFGIAVNYALSVRFVFSLRRLQSQGGEFAVFVLVGVVGLALNAALMAFAVEALHRHYLLGKALASGATFLFNFEARRRLLFTPAARELRCPPQT